MAAAQRFSALNDATPMLTQLFAAEAVPARTDMLSPMELGGLAWLAELDVDDRAEAVAEIRDALAMAMNSKVSTPLRNTLHAWATTATVMRDPIRRAVHTHPADDCDFVDVEPPSEQ